MGTAVGCPVGDLVGRAVGLRAGITDGIPVGLVVGFRVGTAVGVHVSSCVVVVSPFPKSTQWPAQLGNNICCHRTLSGLLAVSGASSRVKIVPFEPASVHV